MNRHLVAVLLAGVLVSLAPSVVTAESPTPAFSGAPWGQDQHVTYRWQSGEVPPSWLQSLVHAAAADARASRASRAATFGYSAAGSGVVSYGPSTHCGAGALACARRDPSRGWYWVAFRKQGQQVSWGTIRWCHTYTSWPAGCFDAELSALHEFGHVEILDHNGSTTYPATIMRDVQAAYPQAGWNQHAFGRCDVATLQKTYDMQSWSALYSTCLTLASTSALSASATAVRAGTTVTFTATLRTANNRAYERLADNPLHGRSVVLQRASIGGSSWIDVATMTPAAAAGVYTRALSINAAYQWRVAFRPSGEGVQPSTSPAVSVRLA